VGEYDSTTGLWGVGPGTALMAKHRHSQGEILHKLNVAERMATEGRSQRDIASSLNVSVMTYHRWRKANRILMSSPPGLVAQPTPSSTILPRQAPASIDQRLDELQTENQRLRKLVTDLLLEKIKLEEESSRDNLARPENGHAVAL
jgi:putative transposase